MRTNGSAGRAARAAKAAEIMAAHVARQRRKERAAVLARQGATGLTSETEKTLTTATKHVERAMGHCDAVTSQHAVLSDHLDDLRTAHRKLSGTLKNLNVADNPQVSRHMSAADSSLRAAKGAFEDAGDTHVNVEMHVSRAGELVRSVLTGGLETTEPDSAE